MIEEVGRAVRNLRKGDRVLIPSTISCGFGSYCRSGYTAQCDTANPNGAAAGTAFFGGPKMTGPFQGLQAQYARTPLAHASLIRLPALIAVCARQSRLPVYGSTRAERDSFPAMTQGRFLSGRADAFPLRPCGSVPCSMA